MLFFNFFIAMIFTYYLTYILSFFNKKRRVHIQETNKTLNIYRQQPIKTLEQQKEFLNIKHPYRKWKFDIKQLPNVIFYIFIYIICIRGFLFIFNKLNIQFNIWTTLIIILLLPLFINLLLQKWNLERTDLFTFFRRAKKK